MNKRKFIFALSIIVSLFCTGNIYAKNSIVGKTFYICLDPATLMEKPSALSKKVNSLNYGDKVLIVDEKSNWVLIQSSISSNVAGWVPLSAVSKKKVTSAKRISSADADEIALAGKGFSSSIESEYAKEFNVDYSGVDYVEQQKVSPQTVKEFLREGSLNMGDEE